MKAKKVTISIFHIITLHYNLEMANGQYKFPTSDLEDYDKVYDVTFLHLHSLILIETVFSTIKHPERV